MSDDSNKSVFIRKFLMYVGASFFALALAATYLSANSDGKKEGVLQLHGWVEGTNVTLSAKLAGQLKSVSVEEGDKVEVGQPVFEIDSGQIKAQLSAAEAAVERAKHKEAKATNDLAVLGSTLDGAKIALKLAEQRSSAVIAQSESAVLAARAQLVETEALFSRAEKDYRRSVPLVKDNTISQSAFDEVEEHYFSKKAMVDRVNREVELAEASKRLAVTTLVEIDLKKNAVLTLERRLSAGETAVEIAKSELAIAMAEKDRAEEDIVDTSGFSPVSGTVIDKVAESGEYTVNGSPVAVVVDLDNLYVKTYVEQTKVGAIKIGDRADIRVDSFPGQVFVGEVYFIASEAEFTPRNIQMDEHRSTMVYKVKVRVHNPGGLIKPGLPADVNLKMGRISA